MPTETIKDFGVRLIACFTVLWTPFFFFSSYRGHPIPAAALIYSAILFASAALVFTLIIGRNRGARRVAVFTLIVCLFLDLQVPQFNGATAYVGALVIAGIFWLIREHLAVIVASVFTTVLVSSAVTSQIEPYVDHTMVTYHHEDGDTPAAPGRVVHLILDGFSSVSGIPKEIAGGPALRSEIEDFFRSYDFTLYPNAISEYAVTRNSISGILNFEASSTPERHIHGKRPIVLKDNAYFERLHERGFEINVYQSTYMDYCAETPVPLATCFTYRYDGTDWLRTSSLSDSQKLSALLGMYLNLPGAFESIWKAYVGLRELTANIGVSLPAVMIWDGTPAPIAAMSAFDHYRETVLLAPSGTAHFAHVLLPHGPFIYDENCQMREEPLGWLGSHPLHRKDNTPAGRELRYQQYFPQVQCTFRELSTLFDGLKAEGKWADTEIILHGDHAARIYLTAPRNRNRERLTANDLADGFSTLFAVKLPYAQHGASDETIAPISRLLAEIALPETERVELDTTLSVYLEGQNNDFWTSIPWPQAP
jgi:hypothetical protein